MKRSFRFLFSLLFLFQGSVYGVTIAEKKEGTLSSTDTELSPQMKELLQQTNERVNFAQHELQALYRDVEAMWRDCAPPEVFVPVLARINHMRNKLRQAQSRWQEAISSSEKGESYSLWHQPDTTIGQLIDDYASEDHIYMFSPEIGKIKLSVSSNLPIPRSSWGEILELILNHNGIGIRQLNPYLRELYLLSNDNANLKLITSCRGELDFLSPDDRVAFVLQPEALEVKRIWYFLNRFVSPTTTTLQMVGREILIIGRVIEIQELLKVYDFVSTHKSSVEYKAVRVTKVDVEEMAKTLTSIFDVITETPKELSAGAANGNVKNRPPQAREEPQRQAPSGGKGQQVYGSNSLKVIALTNIAQALVLIGTRDEIQRAEEIIKKVEDQVGNANKRKIYWYNVKNSDPEELAQVLARIYDLMIATNTGRELPPPGEMPPPGAIPPPEGMMVPPSPFPSPPAPRENFGPIPQQGYFLNASNYLIDPDELRPPRPEPNQGRDNFIVDLKTSSLVMVVEEDLWKEIKELIKKLDVPKKMVQIEIMLVEQVLVHRDAIGLNVLNIGSLATQKNITDLVFNPGDLCLFPGNGITRFIISRPCSHNSPGFDLAYQFLISRDDVRVNASPSVLTVNQTTAIIEIEEEISVSTGTFLVPNGATTTTQESFARARYGIRIEVTPTVHINEPHRTDGTHCGELVNYITLDSDIKFETIVGDPLTNTQPPVIRRALTNQARVADGQTVIIGGFRRKDTSDLSRAIPFLGELPGIGKLFSSTQLNDTATEMFLFMTSKIVSDPEVELERIKMEEMSRRAGDLPYFTKALVQAREQEQRELFQGTMTLLFGHKPDRLVDTETCEALVDIGKCDYYDGR